MNLIFKNDLDIISWVRFLICIACGILIFYFEFTQKLQLSYSKFNNKVGLDSKKGMLIIYFLPLATYLYYYSSATFIASDYHRIILIAVTLHFAKRCIEVLILHRYSGKISIFTILFITWAYSSVAYSIHGSVNYTHPEMLVGINPFLCIGFCLFLIGEGSNLYHHILLSKLRYDSTSDYKIPEGGLFSYINCPHYLSEIISWIGIAIMSKYLIVYGLTFIMSAYLIGRSINTSRWYKEKILNFPKDRKSIIPFLL